FGTFCIGGRFHVHHHVTEDTWLIKNGKPEISPEWLFLDEHRAVTENRCPDPVIRAFQLAGIEYGRADPCRRIVLDQLPCRCGYRPAWLPVTSRFPVMALLRRRSTGPYTAGFGSNADINWQLPDIAIYEYTP